MGPTTKDLFAVRQPAFYTVPDKEGELMMTTKRRSAALLVAVGLAALPALARAQDPKPITESVTITATIEAIDKTAKKVTLKGPKGNYVEVDASGVPRFDQLKVGDQVSATYYESLAVHVRKPGDPAPTAGSTGVTQKEGAPGATAARQQTVTVTVEAVDVNAPSVTVKTADGRVLSFRVQDPKNLAGIKVGDKVDVTYTQALLVKVDPPAK
jgi:Cu/Ag efflux protein CusF